jgi:hypothetical protein
MTVLERHGKVAKWWRQGEDTKAEARGQNQCIEMTNVDHLCHIQTL